MRITWDESKRVADLERHGFDFAAIEPEFSSAPPILPARKSRRKAVRWRTGRLMTVIFAFLGQEAISI